jgi:hypothetical protein
MFKKETTSQYEVFSIIADKSASVKTPENYMYPIQVNGLGCCMYDCH